MQQDWLCSLKSALKMFPSGENQMQHRWSSNWWMLVRWWNSL